MEICTLISYERIIAWLRNRITSSQVGTVLVISCFTNVINAMWGWSRLTNKQVVEWVDEYPTNLYVFSRVTDLLILSQGHCLLHRASLRRSFEPRGDSFAAWRLLKGIGGIAEEGHFLVVLT